MRTVTINLCEEFNDRMADHGQKVNAAIGYLTMWAIHSERYKNLFIYGDDEGCLGANYADSDGKTTYHIFGQWDAEGEYYTFHS